ncbi:MAG TPA: primosomal protein N' [Nocardioides sp.]|uniref:primosomal protein N' n=1 Tax=Nocardioides sp. TaxID=35761 RepID=UPI002E2FC2E5|nr:primosomal protein N' [Nocardioides sp.]HEX3932078.1 primosomal protein N' [Nocardioides sp.]
MATRRESAAQTLPGLRETVRAARPRPTTGEPVADSDPVAQVLVDTPLAHLDRPFDYAVPGSMANDAVPGARVKVRFAGKSLGGFVLGRSAHTDHTGTLSQIQRVVSPEPVLRSAVAELAGLLAERYAGTRSDVVRLAVPPRHATTERQPSAPEDPLELDVASATGLWSGYPAADAFLSHLAGGGSPRAVWSALPGEAWPRLLAAAAALTLAGGRGSLLVVPDRRDVARLDSALRELLGTGHHVVLTAGAGPARRYREFLAVSRGTRRIVVGTRAAAFAPVHDLGLVAIWDDGDDLHAEPRAPYPHAREVLLSRAHLERSATLVGGFARTVEAQQLLTTGWAHEIAAPRDALRAAVRVSVAGATDHELDRDPMARATRVPRQVYDAIGAGLERGPVLLQTPRRGYAPSLACERCRTPARCAVCTGPLAVSGPAVPPACRWCGVVEESWACHHCGHRGLRAPVVGERRTAEELGRAFASVPVVASGGDHVVETVRDRPAIVVSTPGAEPVAERGYAAVVLLDTWLTLARADLRTDEEALRRWLGAAGLVGPGGQVVAVGDPAHPALQALVRWDSAGFARREAEARSEAHLPPASRLATITGDPGAVDDALTLLDQPRGTEVLGPVELGDGESRLVVRSPRAQAAALSLALGEVQRLRSSRKLDPVRIQVDPPAL